MNKLYQVERKVARRERGWFLVCQLICSNQVCSVVQKAKLKKEKLLLKQLLKLPILLPPIAGKSGHKLVTSDQLKHGNHFPLLPCYDLLAWPLPTFLSSYIPVWQLWLTRAILVLVLCALNNLLAFSDEVPPISSSVRQIHCLPLVRAESPAGPCCIYSCTIS